MRAGPEKWDEIVGEEYLWRTRLEVQKRILTGSLNDRTGHEQPGERLQAYASRISRQPTLP